MHVIKLWFVLTAACVNHRNTHCDHCMSLFVLHTISQIGATICDGIHKTSRRTVELFSKLRKVTKRSVCSESTWETNILTHHVKHVAITYCILFLSKTEKIRFAHYSIWGHIDIIGYLNGSTSSKFVSASFKSFTFGAECISMWTLCSYRINLNISCWLIKKLSSKYNTSINLMTYFSSRTTG